MTRALGLLIVTTVLTISGYNNLKAGTLQLYDTGCTVNIASSSCTASTLVAYGTPDSHWFYKTAPSPYPTGPGTALTVGPYPFAWLGEDGISRWLSPVATCAPGGSPCPAGVVTAPGQWVAETNFDLSSVDYGKFQLNVNIAVDDSFDLYLNGTDVFTSPCSACYGQFYQTAITGPFSPTLNVLDIAIHDVVDQSPTGFRVEFSYSFRSTPEPATWLVLAAGVVAVGLACRRLPRSVV